LISLSDFSKKKSELIASSNKTKTSMFSELPRVKDSKESLKDSELNTYKRNPIEVTERLDVLELGTLLE